MRILDAILAGFVSLGVFAISIITILQVIFRYGFSRSLAWGEEVATFIMIWTAMIGLASMLGRGNLISFELFLTKSSGVLRRILTFIVVGSTLAFIVYIIVFGLRMVLLRLTTGVSSAAEIPLQWIYASFPVGGIFMVLQICRRLRAGGDGLAMKLEEGGTERTDS